MNAEGRGIGAADILTATVNDTRSRLLLSLLGMLLWAFPVHAYDTIFRGKVVRDDGSPLARLVVVQRVCSGNEQPVREGVASPKTGEYFIRLDVDPFGQFFG